MIEIRKISKISKNNCDLIFFNRLKEFIKTPKRIFFLKAKKIVIEETMLIKNVLNFFFL